MFEAIFSGKKHEIDPFSAEEILYRLKTYENMEAA
jgi:hypothetical protein